jgi:hypothetical protein
VRGWIGRLTLVTSSTLVLVAGGMSLAHATCPAQDVACLADESAGTGRNLAEDTIGPVDAPGDETTAPVTDAVEPVTTEVLDRVRDLLDGAGVDPPDPIGGGGGGGGDHSSGREPRGTPRHAPRHESPTYERIPGGPGLQRVFDPSSEIPSGTVFPRPADRTSGKGFESALSGVAQSLAVVLALFGLAVGFVAIQDRLDRNDPRLALAPVESDIVEFA